MPRNSSAARMALARPRVDMISSPVAMNVGHIVGRLLEATAAAVALFQIGGERAVLGGEREYRLKREVSANNPRRGAVDCQFYSGHPK